MNINVIDKVKHQQYYFDSANVDSPTNNVSPCFTVCHSVFNLTWYTSHDAGIISPEIRSYISTFTVYLPTH